MGLRTKDTPAVGDSCLAVLNCDQQVRSNPCSGYTRLAAALAAASTVVMSELVAVTVHYVNGRISNSSHHWQEILQTACLRTTAHKTDQLEVAARSGIDGNGGEFPDGWNPTMAVIGDPGHHRSMITGIGHGQTTATVFLVTKVSSLAVVFIFLCAH